MTDPKVEEIRALLPQAHETASEWANEPGGDEAGPYLGKLASSIDYLLTKLDEAEAKNARYDELTDMLADRDAAFAEYRATEERERVLIAGIREEITNVIADLDSARRDGTIYTYGNVQAKLAVILSRLLPSQLPTAPGLYEGPRGARWELDAEGQWWFRGYPDREHPTPNQQDRTEFDVLTYGMPLLPSTPTEEGKKP